jgi:flagellar biosynthesis protein FlhF
MQTKTYFATSVPAALEVARKELGVDAMLVNSRPAPPEVRALGRLEVTFAYDPKTGGPADLGRLFPGIQGGPLGDLRPAMPESPAPNVFAGFNPGPNRYSRSELDELRQQIAALRAEVGQSGSSVAGAPVSSVASSNVSAPAFAEYFSAATAVLDEHGVLVKRLLGNGLDTMTAREITAAAAAHPGERQAALAQELTSRIRTRAFGEITSGACRMLAFIGPPGRGKTTTLVKIAVQYGIARRIPVKIYSAGAHSMGGQEQMARYAALLGVPFHAFETPESLHLALNGDGWKGLVLIDTPGISPSEPEEMSGLAGLFSRHPEIEKHLVLRAEASATEMLQAVTRFFALGPGCLLFTGLDEASGPGAMVETLIRSGLPAVFAGTGPRIPEDIEEVNASKLAAEICGVRKLAASAAA